MSTHAEARAPLEHLHGVFITLIARVEANQKRATKQGNHEWWTELQGKRDAYEVALKYVVQELNVLAGQPRIITVREPKPPILGQPVIRPPREGEFEP